MKHPICELFFSTFFASHRRSPCEPQRLRTACRAPATGLPAAQPHSLRRQLVGSAWTRARRDGNPTHGASTRLRFCNKVCLACAGDAQSSRDDAGSLGSTSKADLVAKNLCSIRRWFTARHRTRLCRSGSRVATRRRRLSMRAHPRRRGSQPACGGDQVTGIGCDTGESSSGTEDAFQVIPATHGARSQCAITLLDPILAGPLRM